jgi:cell wall-associated NlpC family hydrolase
VLAACTLISPRAFADTTAEQARQRVQQAAQQLTVLDEKVQEAQAAVAAQQKAAADAAKQAATAQAAVDAYEPQLRAIAQSSYGGESRSRMAAFLTSTSAADLVQQMTTLDVIAAHTNEVIAGAAHAQAVAQQAKATADRAAAQASASLAQLQQEQTQAKAQVTQYQAEFARLSSAEQAAVLTAISGQTLKAPSASEISAMAPSQAIATIIRTAVAQVGKPYAWGATGPNSFDCSGLTSFAYAAAGYVIPHTSAGQSQLGQTIDRAHLQPGDLIFFYSPISHVGLYIGNGMMVHARTFGSPVAVVPVDQAGYRFAKRIING